MSRPSTFPPKGCSSRSVLVSNISSRASERTIDEFFSFCGTIADKRVKLLPPSSPKKSSDPEGPTLEAYVIFESESARQSALLLDGSTILDQRVTIVAAPDSWDEVPATTQTNGHSNGSTSVKKGGGLFSFLPGPAAEALNTTTAGIGGFLGDMGHVIGEEAAKVGDAWKESNEHGVLKKARDHATAATEKTRDAAVDFDERFGVKDKVLAAASVSKTKAQQVAEVVAAHTKSVAATVDEKFKVRDKASSIASKAMENEIVTNGYNSIVQGWNTLWDTTLNNPTSSGTSQNNTDRPRQSPTSESEPRA